jgi:hypothetical protein
MIARYIRAGYLFLSAGVNWGMITPQTQGCDWAMDQGSRRDMQVVDELHRRKVLRSTTIYAVLGWCLLQWCNVFFESLGWPGWTVTLVLTAVVLGFPVVVALSWVFDITPQGVKRSDTENAPAQQTPATNHMVTIVVLLVLAATAVLLVAQ